MKPGDLVRFRRAADGRFAVNWGVGLIIEYHKWEKVVTVLYNDQVLRIPGKDVQKYGRRYLAE